MMGRQVFSNVFVLFANCEQDEAGINYNLWIDPQHQVTMWEGQYYVYMTVYSPQFSKFVKFVLENVVQACKLLKSQSKMP